MGSGGIDWLLGPVDGFKDAAFDVSIEIRCDAETTATRPTNKCFFAGMNEEVLSEGRGSVERLFAHPAAVLLLPRAGWLAILSGGGARPARRRCSRGDRGDRASVANRLCDVCAGGHR